LRTTLVTLVTVAAVAPWLSACGAAEHPDPSPTSATTASVTSIDITIKGGTVTPDGDRVKVQVGAPVTLHIDADTSGEIHVHSTPEQEIEFSKGTSIRRLTITKPGIVDVEDHALDQVIVQLEAS
jgi:hypothetical protein